MNNSTHFDIIIIGGGAAGFFAAINSASINPTLSIAILEKSGKLLSKVRVSGGGRCNVTHGCFDVKELIKFYPRGGKELRGAFTRFSPEQTFNWFDERGVDLKTEEDGRVFPVSDNSETIINCFLTEAEKFDVNVLMNSDVKKIEKENDQFILTVNEDQKFTCSKLLIASGGFPKSESYDFISNAGHTIVTPVPSLFTFNMPGNPIKELMGVSVENAEVKILDTNVETSGPLLITHWGMSGPAILKASAWGARILFEKGYRFSVTINWLPGQREETIFEELKSSKTSFNTQYIANSNPYRLPKRLWDFILTKSGIKDQSRWSDLSHKELRCVARHLTMDTHEVAGKTTFKEEFVTSGGIALDEVNFKTMESKLMPGLFFAGEILNIDGVTGGFNFQACWTTAFLAAHGMTS